MAVILLRESHGKWGIRSVGGTGGVGSACWKPLSLNFCRTVCTRSENTSEPPPTHLRTTSEPCPSHIWTTSEPQPTTVKGGLLQHLVTASKCSYREVTSQKTHCHRLLWHLCVLWCREHQTSPSQIAAIFRRNDSHRAMGTFFEKIASSLELGARWLHNTNQKTREGRGCFWDVLASRGRFPENPGKNALDQSAYNLGLFQTKNRVFCPFGGN